MMNLNYCAFVFVRAVAAVIRKEIPGESQFQINVTIRAEDKHRQLAETLAKRIQEAMDAGARKIAKGAS